MKTDDYVKSKAMDKLKEINSSKNSEGNAKAQQYLNYTLSSRTAQGCDFTAKPFSLL